MRDKVILSMSTIPPRFGAIGESLNALLNQRKQADEIHVYVPRHYKRFPEHVFKIPDVPDGVMVKVLDEDYGPATKVLPCARLNRGTQTRIVYGDDDRFCDHYWLETLLAASTRRPNDVIVSAGMTLKNYEMEGGKTTFLPRAERKKVRTDYQYLAARLQQKALEILKGSKRQKPARRHYEKAGYVDFALGLGGVSVHPDFFDDICYDIPPVLWAVDDVWLSGNYTRQGIGIWADDAVKMPTETSAAHTASLASSVNDGHDRWAADRGCISYMQEKYDIWT